MGDRAKQSRRDVLSFLGSAATLALVPPALSAQQVSEPTELLEYPYTVAGEPWPQALGNHRIHLYVDQASEAVWAHILWRRTDSGPEQKAVLIFDSCGSEILNTVVADISQDSCDVIFEAKQSGIYFLYYLPHEEAKGRHSVLGPKGQYRAPRRTGEASWTRRYDSPRQQTFRNLPRARVIEFQARTPLDSFGPMLIPATAREVARLCEQHPQPILLFPENREHPVKMNDRLPLRWIKNGPAHTFTASALRGEYYVLQIGVYLRPDSPVASKLIRLHFEDFTGVDDEKLPAGVWSCLNTDITDEFGTPSHYEIQIERGKVAALWCGAQVPLEIKPGQYSGRISAVLNDQTVSIRVDLKVEHDFIRVGGVDQSWRLSRIGWLNSKIGLEESITAPYVPLQLHGRTVTCLGREIRFGENGFPVSIRANGSELLAAPIAFTVNGQTSGWTSTSEVEFTSAARIVTTSINKSEAYTLQVRTTIEFDGGIGFDIMLISSESQVVSNIALEIPYRKDAVPYSVGMGLTGGKRPRDWHWRWSDQPQSWKEQGSNLEYFLWLGDVDAGLYCRLKSPLDGWKNRGNGFIRFAESADWLLFQASTGARQVRANEKMAYSFRLLPTPVKPLDPQHWKYRYAQSYQPPAKLRAMGATVNNIHQGTPPNMYINYPFLNLDLLEPYISEAHSLGMKVKIYYTMRELSTRLPELWMFRSLGNEIYQVGGTQGQGDPQLDFWLQEHLRHDYSPGWITLTSTGDIDTSLRVNCNSRLANFYLEGLNWLLSNACIDGIYLDEIGYSRSTMQRVRRVTERRSGAMIDMHGNHDWWSCECPIGYYLEHLPYIDRLWLGEAFDPDSPPEFWLIEMSGIPFGLSSDMLESPNPWRGMLFGMTARLLYSGPSPEPIWKLWDSFGIQDAFMIGWWDSGVPVRTGRRDVLATVYKKEGRSLIALASWSAQTIDISLEIDWNILGIDEQSAEISAPDMGYFQSAKCFRPEQAIQIPACKGYLLIVEQRENRLVGSD